MSIGKELLVSCIVMMHISFMASRPVDVVALWKNMKVLEGFSVFCYLQKAENYYVKHMFGEESQMDYKSNTLEPIEGITFGNTTEEIQASICAIPDYLNNHLPVIMENLIRNMDPILDKTRAFLDQFKDAVAKSSRGQNETSVPKQCHRNVTTSDDYTKKVLGLRIIYFTRKWVETFTDTNALCG